jgi:V/A-type H+-transporting ATPase subunit E
MGLETVKDEILNSAKSQASAMTAEARKEANRIASEAEKKAEEIKAKNEAEAKRSMDTIKRQEMSSAELESKKMLLEAKKQIVEAVFADSRKKIESLPDKKREELIKKLLEKAKKDIEIAYVYCSSKDAKFIKGFDVQNADMIGGLMAENRERTIRVDYSFETLLQSIKENELQSISKLLF